jgi:hypothetical protein
MIRIHYRSLPLFVVFLGLAILIWSPWRGPVTPVKASGDEGRPKQAEALGRDAADKKHELARVAGMFEVDQGKLDDAVAKKIAVRKELMEHSSELFLAAMDPGSSDDQISKLLDKFRAARKSAESELRKIDDELTKGMPVRTHARLLTSGVLENGLGFKGGRALSTSARQQASRTQGMRPMPDQKPPEVNPPTSSAGP